MAHTAGYPNVAGQSHAGPWYQAFRILQFVFIVGPLMAGIDKFFHVLADWTIYLAPIVPQTLNISAHNFMMGVGVIEIIAALIVLFKPRIGGYIVSAWLMGIVINLLLIPGFYDIALRDFGLALSAFALARLATQDERS